MTEHDPLCIHQGRATAYCRVCQEVIAKVRADERERIARAIEARKDFAWPGCPSTLCQSEAYLHAARIASGGGRDEAS